jgi:hypothetical protein
MPNLKMAGNPPGIEQGTFEIEVSNVIVTIYPVVKSHYLFIRE